jgi:peptidoglycan/LPS O-acetylase OafA/YrhL
LTGSILAMTAVKRRKRNVRGRTVVLGFVLIVALALFTGSVLLIGYVAAAASLLAVLILLVKRAIRGDSTAPIESFVPRWVDAKDREAA